MRVFIGLDVSLAKTAVCVVDHDGAVQWQGKVPSEPGPLIKRLAEWHGMIELAGIEACPLSEWLHRGLREAGIPVVCIETRHAQRFLSSRPVKTDKNDARGIAETTARAIVQVSVFDRTVVHPIFVGAASQLESSLAHRAEAFDDPF